MQWTLAILYVLVALGFYSADGTGDPRALTAGLLWPMSVGVALYDVATETVR